MLGEKNKQTVKHILLLYFLIIRWALIMKARLRKMGSMAKIRIQAIQFSNSHNAKPGHFITTHILNFLTII